MGCIIRPSSYQIRGKISVFLYSLTYNRLLTNGIPYIWLFKAKPKRNLGVDTTEPKICTKMLKDYYWRDLYKCAKQYISSDTPEPRVYLGTTHQFFST